MAISYDVGLTRTGFAETIAVGVTSPYTAESLVLGATYNFRVRAVDLSSGVTFTTDWSDPVEFVTVQGDVSFSFASAIETSVTNDLIFGSDPVVTLVGSNPQLIITGDAYVELNATAFDDDDGDISGSIVITGTVDTATKGIYTKTYTVTDSDGRTSFAKRDIHVNTALAATSYSIRYNEVGQAATTITGIASSPYTLEGLVGGTDYEFQVKADTDGIEESEWSAKTAFSTTAVQHVYMDFTSATETSIAEPLSLVAASTADVDFSFTPATETSTTQDMVLETAEALPLVAATSWDLEITDLTTGILTETDKLNPLLSPSFVAQGLTEGTEHFFQVRGKSGGNVSEWSEKQYFATIHSTHHVVLPVAQADTELTFIEVLITSATVDEVNEIAVFTGTVNQPNTSVRVNFFNKDYFIDSQVIFWNEFTDLYEWTLTIGEELEIGSDELEPIELIANSNGDTLLFSRID